MLVACYTYVGEKCEKKTVYNYYHRKACLTKELH
jgi:hypothetical protein